MSFFLINQTNYFVCGFSCSFKKENLIKFVMCCRCTSRMKNASVTSCLTYCCQERESGITTADTGVAQLSVLVALVVKNMAVTWLLLHAVVVAVMLLLTEHCPVATVCLQHIVTEPASFPKVRGLTQLNISIVS